MDEDCGMNRFDSYFTYRENELQCEGLKLSDLARQYGTPLYVYVERGFRESYEEINSALSEIEHLICYSIKTNFNMAIIRLMASLGSGADVVSGGELYRSLKAGIAPEKIVFAGVGKTREEIEYAIDAGILMFNCESFQEIELIEDVSAAKGKKTSVAIRINPDVDAKTHHYITTGKKENKFGITIHRLEEYLPRLKQHRNIVLRGIHGHIGSQITSIEPYIQTVEKFISLIADLKKSGWGDIEYVNLGGGMGIVYNEEASFDVRLWAKKIVSRLAPLGLKLIVEPGRYISGNSGVLTVKVIYRKEGESKTFFITDGGMNDLIRPSLYGAYQNVLNCTLREGKEVADVVGPVCESGDFFAKDREMTPTLEGDYLAVMSAGAYCMAMASHYNSRRLPAEVLLSESGEVRLIRRRDTWEDLLRNEEP